MTNCARLFSTMRHSTGVGRCFRRTNAKEDDVGKNEIHDQSQKLEIFQTLHLIEFQRWLSSEYVNTHAIVISHCDFSSCDIKF